MTGGFTPTLVGTLIGVGILLIGLVIGYVLGNHARNRRMCGCSHSNGFHDPASGECKARVELVTARDNAGIMSAFVIEECACRHYDGPLPEPKYYRKEWINA